MTKNTLGIVFGVAVLVVFSHKLVFGFEKGIDAGKSNYALDNATPKEKMRPFISDQASIVDSAYTIDAGHYQLEARAIDYFYDRDSSNSSAVVTTNSFKVLPVTFRAGLYSNHEMSASFDPYGQNSVSVNGGLSKKSSGFGFLTLRTKYNVMGNDSGDMAIAIQPTVRIPVGSEFTGKTDVEASVASPISVKLPSEFQLGLRPELEWIEQTGSRGFGFTTGIALSRPIIDDLTASVGFTSRNSFMGNAPWDSRMVVATSYDFPEEQVKLDIGARIGLTRAAANFNPYLGSSFRF